jgi:hypothetical protein
MEDEEESDAHLSSASVDSSEGTNLMFSLGQGWCFRFDSARQRACLARSQTKALP